MTDAVSVISVIGQPTLPHPNMCYDFFMGSFMQKDCFLLQPKLRRLQELQTEIYRQLQLLIPDQVAHYDSFQSRVHGSPLLRMDILERHPFTHFVRLTYQFDRKEPLEIAPDAHIRVYNDARLAEVTSFDHVQGFERPGNEMDRPDERNQKKPAALSNGLNSHTDLTSSMFKPLQTLRHSWRRNQALDKWLSYLLHQGHGLSTMNPASDRISGEQAALVKQTSRSA